MKGITKYGRGYSTTQVRLFHCVGVISARLGYLLVRFGVAVCKNVRTLMVTHCRRKHIGVIAIVTTAHETEGDVDKPQTEKTNNPPITENGLLTDTNIIHKH